MTQLKGLFPSAWQPTTGPQSSQMSPVQFINIQKHPCNTSWNSQHCSLA